MQYNEIRERVVEGVVRDLPSPPPLDRVRMMFDASFFQINSQVAEAFAARQDWRELLRTEKSLTFTSGSATLSSDVLKKYVADGTFEVSGSPTPHYGFRRYPDYIRGADPRLGAWSTIGESIVATTPGAIGSGATPLSGAATLTAICSPAIPATEDAEFVCPDDFLPEFINAAVQFIRGQIMNEAAETA